MTPDRNSLDPSALSSSSPKAGWRSLAELATLGTLLLLIASWIFSLNGRSVHEGYLHHLRLETSMFPLASGDAAYYATFAWFRLITDILSFGSRLPLWSLPVMVLLIVLAVSAMTWLNRRADAKARPEPKPPFGEKSPLVRAVFINNLATFLAIYTFLAMLVLVALVIVSIVNPFRAQGECLARDNLHNGYSDAPLVMLQPPGTNTTTEYRVVMCSALFCALYEREGVPILAVPIGKLEWARAAQLPGQDR